LATATFALIIATRLRVALPLVPLLVAAVAPPLMPSHQI